MSLFFYARCRVVATKTVSKHAEQMGQLKGGKAKLPITFVTVRLRRKLARVERGWPELLINQETSAAFFTQDKDTATNRNAPLNLAGTATTAGESHCVAKFN